MSTRQILSTKMNQVNEHILSLQQVICFSNVASNSPRYVSYRYGGNFVFYCQVDWRKRGAYKSKSINKMINQISLDCVLRQNVFPTCVSILQAWVCPSPEAVAVNCDHGKKLYRSQTCNLHAKIQT